MSPSSTLPYWYLLFIFNFSTDGLIFIQSLIVRYYVFAEILNNIFRNNYSFKIIQVNSFQIECQVEICGILYKFIGSNAVIIIVYRPQNMYTNIFYAVLTQVHNLVSSNSDYVILLGDFNIDCQSMTLLKSYCKMFSNIFNWMWMIVANSDLLKQK